MKLRLAKDRLNIGQFFLLSVVPDQMESLIWVPKNSGPPTPVRGSDLLWKLLEVLLNLAAILGIENQFWAWPINCDQIVTKPK